jgi:hypothetical protein
MHRNQNHDWDGTGLCSCGARRCDATKLSSRNESVRCRSAARDGSQFCDRHRYLDRYRSAKREPLQDAA